jgi:flagellar basal-body rod modification protein FlgD
MSEISSISTTASTTATTSTNELSGQLGQETFLKLLTVQLQNQDPLDPMSNEAFVEQLATFSMLEELINVNATLEAVYMGVVSMNNASMAGLVGTQVVARADDFAYDGESDTVSLAFDAPQQSVGTQVNITDSDGTVIYSGDIGEMESGEGAWTWDGKKTDGSRASEGDYSFQFTGTDADGNSVAFVSLIIGTIDEMDYSTGTPLPSVDGIPIEVADIIRLTLSDTGSEGSSAED